jgi:L-threonylcarbamoyladenylate synthase
VPGTDDVAGALAHLRADGLVAYPTETVWGLGVNARSPLAVTRLREWKGRADDAPISLLVSGADALERLGVQLHSGVRHLIRAFWPGPLTLVLSCTGGFPPGIAREDGAIGFRCSSHPLASSLARACEELEFGPLTATSFNRSGERPAERYTDALALGGSTSELFVPEAACACDAFGESPSTVLDWTADEPRVIRWGSLTAAALAPTLERATAELERALAQPASQPGPQPPMETQTR